ncbi:MAG: serine hydrolase domain-containing protein [Pirellulaceae bacterium]
MLSRTRLTLWSLVFGTLLPAVALAQEATTWPSIDSIEKHIERHMAEGQISGAVTLVSQKGEVIHAAAQGLANLEDQTAMTPETIFGIASMTKPIAATALMILVDDKKVKLDDPVSKYIPEFADVRLDGEPLESPITLRHCLTHTAGLGGGQQNTGSLAETAQAVAARPLNFKPGTRWQYSPGMTVIGRVVEVASEQKFEDFLAERIFEPLGMTSTTFNPTPDQQARLAVLYQPGPQPKTMAPTTHWLSEVSPTRPPNPSGGLFSTAEDMLKFNQMLLSEGKHEDQQIVSTESVKEMKKLQTGDLETGFTPGNGWGLGVCVIREPQGATAALAPGSFGHGGAFGTQAWIDPEKQMVFILMIQRTNFGNSDASDLRGDFQRLAVEAKP